MLAQGKKIFSHHQRLKQQLLPRCSVDYLKMAMNRKGRVKFSGKSLLSQKMTSRVQRSDIKHQSQVLPPVFLLKHLLCILRILVPLLMRLKQQYLASVLRKPPKGQKAKRQIRDCLTSWRRKEIILSAERVLPSQTKI
ncbi:unnamed protein product [Brassica oleracea var. botrytis]